MSHALDIILKAVWRYKELAEGKCLGESVWSTAASERMKTCRASEPSRIFFIHIFCRHVAIIQSGALLRTDRKIIVTIAAVSLLQESASHHSRWFRVWNSFIVLLQKARFPTLHRSDLLSNSRLEAHISIGEALLKMKSCLSRAKASATSHFAAGLKRWCCYNDFTGSRASPNITLRLTSAQQMKWAKAKAVILLFNGTLELFISYFAMNLPFCSKRCSVSLSLMENDICESTRSMTYSMWH